MPCSQSIFTLFRGCLDNNQQERSSSELIFYIYICRFLWLQVKCSYWVGWSDLHLSMLEGLCHVSLRWQSALFERWVFTFLCFYVFSFQEMKSIFCPLTINTFRHYSPLQLWVTNQILITVWAHSIWLQFSFRVRVAMNGVGLLQQLNPF